MEHGSMASMAHGARQAWSMASIEHGSTASMELLKFGVGSQPSPGH